MNINFRKQDNLIKIINVILLIIFTCYLIVKYNDNRNGIEYFMLGVLPFSIILGGLLSCFIKKWYFIIITYITAIVIEFFFIPKTVIAIGPIYLLFLTLYTYINHILCFKNK